VQAEPPLRATVLRVLARAPGAWPPVRTALLRRVRALPQEVLGGELAALAMGAGPAEGLRLLAALALLLPGAVRRALALLPAAWRAALQGAAGVEAGWAPLQGLLDSPPAPDGPAQQ
jgi:hypothetical protein